MEKDIFFICKVRGVEKNSEEYKLQEEYVRSLEKEGRRVHWPHRDTEQKDPEHGSGICRKTFWAIFRARELHVRYDPTSEGFVADIMMVFALNELAKRSSFYGLLGRKKIVIANPEAVERKIKEETEAQLARGIDPQFAKSYTMVLKNLAEETASLW